MLYPLSYEGRGEGYEGNGQAGAQGVACCPVRGTRGSNPPEGAIDLSTGTGASDLLHAEDSGVDEIVAGKAPVAARSPLQLFWRRFRKDKVALAARIVHRPADLRGDLRRADPQASSARPTRTSATPTRSTTSGCPSGPSSEHLFGVDRSAATSSRASSTARRSRCSVAFVGTGLSVAIGVTMGMIAGFYRGWVDTAIARMIDVLLAFPVLLLGLGLASACSTKDGCLGGALEPGLTVVIVIIILSNWPYVARIIRGQVLSLREKEFVEASTSLGASNKRIIFREILPNLVAPIIVYTTLFIPANILLEAVAVVPRRRRPAAAGRRGARCSPTRRRSSTPPGGTCSSRAWRCCFTVLAFNLVGDGMQDALNPKSSRSR